MACALLKHPVDTRYVSIAGRTHVLIVIIDSFQSFVEQRAGICEVAVGRFRHSGSILKSLADVRHAMRAGINKNALEFVPSVSGTIGLQQSGQEIAGCGPERFLILRRNSAVYLIDIPIYVATYGRQSFRNLILKLDLETNILAVMSFCSRDLVREECNGQDRRGNRSPSSGSGYPFPNALLGRIASTDRSFQEQRYAQNQNRKRGDNGRHYPAHPVAPVTFQRLSLRLRCRMTLEVSQLSLQMLLRNISKRAASFWGRWWSLLAKYLYPLKTNVTGAKP